MDRREKVLGGLALEGLGLEIGGSYGPLAAGDPALKVKTLDHLDQAALIAKYKSAAVDTALIQPVDYVWSGERYLDLIGETRFDWIVASHVIEHVPDLIGFINECAEILAPGGRLSLVVPDKRREFDCYRPPTGLGSVIDAHLEGRRFSSCGLAAEFGLNTARLDGRDIWTDEDRGTPQFIYGLDVAKRLMQRVETGAYVDIHAWVFTPHSFRLMIEDLHSLGLLQLRETLYRPSAEHEFYIQLSPDGAGPGLSRLELCILALQEQCFWNGCLGTMQSEPEASRPGNDPPTEDLEVLRAENARLRKTLEAVRTSTSWRITSALRALKGLIR
ncbi:MAG TPA: methyltransferase domain-containing protein [Caulobacteraceae bacterium]|nr:methyltransferase domain-containing protein [Caulobacteraceae bacterium]